MSASATSFEADRFEARWRESSAGVRTDAEGRVIYSQLQQDHDDDDERKDR